MPFKLPFGRHSGEADESATVEPLSEVPRHVCWRLTRGERIELRELSGELIAWTKTQPSLGAVRARSGQLLAQIKPAVKLSGVDITSAALDGVLSGGAPPPSGARAQPSPEPALAVKDSGSNVTFAVVALDQSGSHVALLPGGAINQRLIARSLGDQDVARMRERAPLRYSLRDVNAYELRDRSDSVLARELMPGDGTASTSEIEVIDNPLPTAWLFAILLACAYQARGLR